jgi:hypothetical protein
MSNLNVLGTLVFSRWSSCEMVALYRACFSDVVLSIDIGVYKKGEKMAFGDVVLCAGGTAVSGVDLFDEHERLVAERIFSPKVMLK